MNTKHLILFLCFCGLMSCQNDSGLLIFESTMEVEFVDYQNKPIASFDYDDNIFFQYPPHIDNLYGYPWEKMQILGQNISGNVMKLEFNFNNAPYRYYSQKEPEATVELRKMIKEGGYIDMPFTVQVKGYKEVKGTARMFYNETTRIQLKLEKQ